jgi:hypothetical protein
MNGGKADAPAGDESIHLVTIDWTRGKWSGTRGKYSREHQWHFAGRLSLKVSDALAPAGYREAERLDPLKSYVATIASAHMLAWLHAAFSHEVEVEKYLDTAEGMVSGLPVRGNLQLSREEISLSCPRGFNSIFDDALSRSARSVRR